MAENVDVHIYKKFFRMSLHSALALCSDIRKKIRQASVELQQVWSFVKVFQKWLGTNMFVHIKSHTGSKFSRIILWQLYTRESVVVHPYYGFSLSDGVTTEWPIQNRVFGQFCSILWKDSIANYGSIWMQFSTSVRWIDVFCNALNYLWLCQYGATRFANVRRKFSQT